MTLLIAVLTWAVCVHAFFIFFAGNPAYTMVERASASLLNSATELLDGEAEVVDEEVYHFVRRFLWQTTAGLLLFVVEVLLASYFVLKQPGQLLGWFILIKNLIVVRLGHRLRQDTDGNVFSAVRNAPSWLVRWERILYFTTGVCFLFFFLLVNDLLR